MKCLRNLDVISRLNIFGNEEAHRRSGIEMDLARRVDQCVVRWFEHVKRIDEYRFTTYIQKGVDGRS